MQVIAELLHMNFLYVRSVAVFLLSNEVSHLLRQCRRLQLCLFVCCSYYEGSYPKCPLHFTPTLEH